MHKNWLTWVISLVILCALGWFFREQLSFVKDGISRLHHAQPLPVILVIFFALLSVAGMAEVMRLLIQAGNVHVPSRETYGITLASNAWSTTLPAGPAFSAILTYQVQRGWGASVALCGYFFFLSSIISSMFLALIGLAGVIFLNADMALGSLITTVVLMFSAAAGIFWLTEHPDTLKSWTRKFTKGAKREKLNAEIDKLHEVHLSRGAFSAVTAASLVHRLGDMLALWASVWAVTGELPWLRSGENATTMAGVALAFLAAKLAGSAQLTPGGIGTVEAAIITPLVATGMTAVDATSAAVIYRLISFALITIIGWVIYFWHYNNFSLQLKDN